MIRQFAFDIKIKDDVDTIAIVIAMRKIAESMGCEVLTDDYSVDWADVTELYEKNKVVELETYGEYIEETDTQLTKKFVVPFNWLEKVIKEEFNLSIGEFMSEYTWDSTEVIFMRAESDGVIK